MLRVIKPHEPRFREETDMVCQATSTFSVSQCDFTSTVGIGPGWPSPAPVDVSCPAKRLRPQQRQDLAIQVLAGTETVSALARQHDLSRKFLYQQVHTAEEALDQAFAPASTLNDVLFNLPVTKSWVQQLVLSLVLTCHSSTRGVVELLRDVFDFRISLGTVHNIVHRAVAHAQKINQQYDLSTIHIGLLDEIFQAGDPVLVGVDAASTFCFLLSLEEHRDADTWGTRLLELVDRGFAPQATIADFASGLRAGHREALPGRPCRGDVFHALYDVGPLVRHLENRAYETIEARAKLERKQATVERRRGRKDQSLVQKLVAARLAEAKAIALADEVALLARWLRHDILSVAGPESVIRRDLFDFVVAELRAREPACPHRIRPVRTLLENQRDNLLAFALELDRDLAALAQEWQISVTTAREVLQVQSLPTWDPKRWHREATLRETLRGRYYGVYADVQELTNQVVRASSLVENLNSRLRSYFFLRRQLGNDYLTLLQFFLNHRRYPRSEAPSRVGKSPAELLTAEPHAHWLELMGYTRFSQN
jgi:transposase-like protein